jgi:S-adenosylmethionine:tRNA ribosyltransferase-isomerase
VRLRDFDFALPPEAIAQQPAPSRERARLYCLPRGDRGAEHRTVADLPSLVPPGALLVVNDTRVIRARLRGHKPSGGRVELLLVRPLASWGDATAWGERWLCLGGASKPLRPGSAVLLDGERAPRAEVAAVRGQEVEVVFGGERPDSVVAAAERIGEVPLPPYIKRPGGPGADDGERYQTVYARVPGAVAAPTAGLHLTPSLLAALEARGVRIAPITLHVGPGTFAPLPLDEEAEVEGLAALHAERYEVPAATARAVAEARAAGRPVLAVGTTTVRALESACADGEPRAGAGETTLFIRPGFRFRAVDAMLTNFHLPRSSLVMLVAALAGRERLLAAYTDAVARGYRFYSYGDAMLIL